jgi:transforming growth factor-beta-induced protein
MSERVNLIDTISKVDMFSTFARILRTANATDLINGDGTFTVFVPTNDAFGKISDAQMNGLLNETDQVGLKKLLSYHIVPGKIFAANLTGTATTLSGHDITFKDKGGLKVNDAGLQARNMEATNGIVHGLDTVLTAPAATASPAQAVAASASGAPAPAITEAPPATKAA